MTGLRPASHGVDQVRAGPFPEAPGEDLLRAIIEAGGEGVVLCGPDDIVVMTNAAAARMVPGIRPGRPVTGGETASLFGPGYPEGESREAAHGPLRLRIRHEVFGIAHRAWYLRDVTDETARADAALAEGRRTAFLIEAGRRLAASLNTRRCARATVELAVPFLADIAMVVLPPSGRRNVQWLRRTGDGPLQEGSVPVTATVGVPGLAESLAGFPPVPSRWLDPGQVPDWVLPEGFGSAGHLLVTPLPGNGVPAGALVLARHEGGPAFDEESETLVRLFASRAGAAISAAALYQEQSATTAVLSGHLLRPDLPVLDGLELAGSLRAAQHAGLIGGDFYDVYLPDSEGSGGPLLVLGDVCGKGAGAAVLAGQVRHALRTLLLLEDRPERLVPLLNRSLLASTAPNSYVTLALGTVETDGDGHVLMNLSVAGHPAPLILRADGTVEEAPVRGSMLGALRKIVVDVVTLDLAPGEMCLFYSDGITEAFGGPSGREMYGTQRLKTALATCAGMPVAAVVERLEQLSTAWLAGDIQDDRALLAVQARAVGR
ncbi:serine phosphatase RsbU (regulator of sigma subunit) [Streptosporangium becharense]|uniref:Serine phosphatase RsbU (Regulator of sigma subunit) n=1 Tax=Streptosporangium becharense TaxID=1816182 RepID=A0A7W9MJW1_9ACTN|nr:PP2C family protein-serine/threonine phosphatase [Streptosporangium becharense]MBB2914276.1 serine phosphatase RsbU (regulator of sigma subunit) [Streptosporangium becharense]MBB5823692.1 serine phosphatase RsbU (regulator of sigma subunit) [Streptosporangium becharense]